MTASRPLVFLLLLTACTDDDAPPDDSDSNSVVANDPLALPVDAEGPYRVGYRSWDLTYTPPVGPARTFGLNVWYPTNDETGEVGRYGVYTDATGTFLDATPAPADDPVAPYASGRPLLVHSHGDQAYGGSASFLFRHLASHGWVVLSADHVDNMLFANVQPTPPLHWVHRPSDLKAMVDALDALESTDPLAGVADTGRYVVSGHSRGGTTVWSILGLTFRSDRPDVWCPGCDSSQEAAVAAADLSDPRARAGLLLATGVREEMYGDGSVTGIDQPVMMMTGTEDGDGGVGAWALMDQIDATWVQIDGGCHETFNLGAPCATMDKEPGFSLVSPHATAFVRHALLGDDAVTDWLDGTTLAGPAVTVTTR